MPQRAMPWVRQGQLTLATGERIRLDTPAWFAWLKEGTSFCYSSPYTWIRLTVRREKRRQHFYWYAYSKIDGKLHNSYLGKADRLTQSRLEQACQQIGQHARKEAVRNNNKEATNA